MCSSDLEAAANLNRYPDASQTALREEIAAVHGLDATRIICGNGSDELIQLVIRAYTSAGDEVLLSENGFVMCEIHAHAQGATVVKAPEREDRVDVDALLARVTSRTRVLCIANPNNPTGTYLPLAEIQRLHAALPSGVMLLLDGAYAEYATAADYDAGQRLVEQHANVVMTRTFSKIYGLPALRIGWAYCPPPAIEAIQRIRSPFNASSAALAAATAAVRDQDWIMRVREHNAMWLQRIAEHLGTLGLEVVPSVANFYLIRFPAGSGMDANGAAAFVAHLAAEDSAGLLRAEAIRAALAVGIDLDHSPAEPQGASASPLAGFRLDLTSAAADAPPALLPQPDASDRLTRVF